MGVGREFLESTFCMYLCNFGSIIGFFCVLVFLVLKRERESIRRVVEGWGYFMLYV